MNTVATKLCESCGESMVGMRHYNARRFCSSECYRASPARGSPATGSRCHGRRRAVVIFDEDQFAEIRQRAVKERTSFTEQVRLLCEWGLEA